MEKAYEILSRITSRAMSSPAIDGTKEILAGGGSIFTGCSVEKRTLH